MNDLQIIIKLNRAKETVCTNCYFKSRYGCFIWREDHSRTKIVSLLQELLDDKNKKYSQAAKDKYKQLLTDFTCSDYRT